jgi:hypothetical protein
MGFVEKTDRGPIPGVLPRTAVLLPEVPDRHRALIATAAGTGLLVG